MSPAARKYLDDNTDCWENAEGRFRSITPAIDTRNKIATAILGGLCARYGTTEPPEVLACYAVNQADWLLEVLAR